ncbi:hypothetical protein L208DRAFT_1551077 [Tricholoma matsutake]|nr:hypothetical protein L208DRAFT_1551077 [Tricholoma matsutake 945]
MSIECSSTVSPTTQIALNTPAPVVPGSKIYDTPEGFVLACKILAQTLLLKLHDFQVEGICAVLDGHDLLATMATGSGKTGYFIMLMLVMHAISEDETLALGGRTFPKDPAIFFVCLKMHVFPFGSRLSGCWSCKNGRGWKGG